MKQQPLTRFRHSLAGLLVGWAQALTPPAESPARSLNPVAGVFRGKSSPHPADPTETASPGPEGPRLDPRPVWEAPAAAFCPAVREPLSVEMAVLQRDMTVLKREASDALAALAAAHALVSSARFAQVQELRHRVEKGEVAPEALGALAGDYQGWQSDQVRLFDALALVLRTQVPRGNVLEQVDPSLHEQAMRHLEALSVEYQRGLLSEQFH
jgi:hypothetical protein